MEQAPDSSVIFGIAKKWTAELEAMPIQSQGTIISMLNAAMQHRKLNLEQRAHEEQVKAQARQIEMMEAHQKRQQDAEDIRRSGIVLAQ